MRRRALLTTKYDEKDNACPIAACGRRGNLIFKYG